MRRSFLVLAALAVMGFAQPAAAAPRATALDVSSIELAHEQGQNTKKKATTKKSKQTPAPTAAQKT